MNISDNLKNLKPVLEKADRIAITSHFPADHDAISSPLLLQNILKTIYPEKQIDVVSKLEFIDKFKEFDYVDTTRYIPAFNVSWIEYDVVLLLDVEDIERAVYMNHENYQEIQNLRKKTIVIDHHDNKLDSRNLLNICNMNYASTTHLIVRALQEVYGDLHLSEESAKLAQLGIIADSNRFLYFYTNDLLSLVTELTAISALDMDQTSQFINTLPKNALYILEYLIHNTVYMERNVYTHFPVEVYDDENLTEQEIKEGCHMYLQNIARNLKDVDMVCLMKPTKRDMKWRLMFRSKRATINVSQLAKYFEGGGHINASSAEIEAECVEEIIEAVEQEARKQIKN